VRNWLDAQPGRNEGQNFLVGVSCHALKSAESAAQNGADYIFFGPVFSTPSKEALGAPQGLPLLAQICRAVTIPVLAIGGITVENAPACLAAGAAGLAAIRPFQDAADLPSLVQALRNRS
jgi:thiamine-phosphate pyrophosphorylase